MVSWGTPSTVPCFRQVACKCQAFPALWRPPSWRPATLPKERYGVFHRAAFFHWMLTQANSDSSVQSETFCLCCNCQIPPAIAPHANQRFTQPTPALAGNSTCDLFYPILLGETLLCSDMFPKPALTPPPRDLQPSWAHAATTPQSIGVACREVGRPGIEPARLEYCC